MLGRIERGLRNPTLETLLKVAHALEIDFGDVINAATRPSNRTKAR